MTESDSRENVTVHNDTGDKMKHVIAGACLFLSAAAATAGGYSEPQVMPPVIVEDAQNSSGDSAMLVLGLMTILVFSAAASSN